MAPYSRPPSGRRRRWVAAGIVVAIVSLVGLLNGPVAAGGHRQARAAGQGRVQPGMSRNGITAPAAASSDPVLVGAGDIASCKKSDDSATAALIESIPGTVFTAGDNAYERGSVLDYRRCYDATWGAFRWRTRPAPGNHEYRSAGARPYFHYFGHRAGPAGKGWYAYNLGTWRIYALNSNCGFVGGCRRGSPQERWLRNDLASHPSQCILAYWHHPLYSSGMHGMDPSVRPFWRDLYAAHADVIVNGHDHDYERFAPLTPYGKLGDAGIREFVVGTGGRGHRPFGVLLAHSEIRNATTSGVLELTLGVDGYSWAFIPIAGQSFTDAGWGSCAPVPRQVARAWPTEVPSSLSIGRAG